MTSNPVSVIVMILLAAFVIDRIVAAGLFLLSFSAAWSKRFPDPTAVEQPEERRRVEKRQKLVYFVFAGVLAFVFLVSFKQVGVLGALGFQADEAADASTKTTGAAGATSPAPTPDATPSSVAGAPRKPSRSLGDFLLTWLILVGGAENIAKLLKGHGDFGREKTESQPIEISGKLTLEDRSERKS